ncbi:MAG TPA: hypothetical protein VK687_04360 [Bryobacteraceae bacterium]|nr:hypothetical protein [Bryobacteraceae bacterium]
MRFHPGNHVPSGSPKLADNLILSIHYDGEEVVPAGPGPLDAFLGAFPD